MLFAESDYEREERLRLLEANEPDTEYIGQRNEFSEELQQLGMNILFVVGVGAYIIAYCAVRACKILWRERL